MKFEREGMGEESLITKVSKIGFFDSLAIDGAFLEARKFTV